MNAAQHPATPSPTASHQNTLRNTAAAGKAANRVPIRLTSQNPRQRAYQPKRIPYAGARQAIAVESSVKLTVNLLLAIVATTTIAKLVPYYQSQQARLHTLQTAVVDAEERNAELRSQFGRNFDPAQAARIMQEQSGLSYPNRKQVIWTKPVDSQSFDAQ